VRTENGQLTAIGPSSVWEKATFSICSELKKMPKININVACLAYGVALNWPHLSLAIYLKNWKTAETILDLSSSVLFNSKFHLGEGGVNLPPLNTALLKTEPKPFSRWKACIIKLNVSVTEQITRKTSFKKLFFAIFSQNLRCAFFGACGLVSKQERMNFLDLKYIDPA